MIWLSAERMKRIVLNLFSTLHFNTSPQEDGTYETWQVFMDAVPNFVHLCGSLCILGFGHQSKTGTLGLAGSNVRPSGCTNDDVKILT